MPVVSTPMTNRPLKRPARASARSQLNGSGNMGAIVARAARRASHFSRWMSAARGGRRWNTLRAGAPTSRLFFPAFRRLRAALDLPRLVPPTAVDFDEGAVLLALRRDLHRIALLFDLVLGEDELRGRRLAVHDDERIADRHDEGVARPRGRTRRLPRRASIRLHDAVPSFVVPLAEDQLGVVGIEVREVLCVLPAEVVVVTRNEILNLQPIDQGFRIDLFRTRSRGKCQHDTGGAQCAEQRAERIGDLFHLTLPISSSASRSAWILVLSQSVTQGRRSGIT